MRPAPSFFEIGGRTNFSFLEGASHPDEMVVAASRLGLGGLGIADRNTLSGVVRAHVQAKLSGLRFQPGARLVFCDGTPDVLAYPMNRTGWGRLCRLLSAGNLRAEKGECHLQESDLMEWGDDLMVALMPGSAGAGLEAGPLSALLARLAARFGDRLFLCLAPRHDGFDRLTFAMLADLAGTAGIPLIATNDPMFHAPERRPVADVMTAIRNHTTIADAGFRLQQNAERHLKDSREMARLLRDHPGAITATQAFFERLHFSLDDLRYQYPEETVEGETAAQTLRRLTLEGATRRYPDGIGSVVEKQIEYELSLIAEKRYEPYFLTVCRIIEFARSQGILCQGRGSAANSAVCFCLGITEVDPLTSRLLFERFLSTERDEPPDIDVDFEHERREEVIQHIYRTYGREHAGLAAAVNTYRARSAGRETAKAFGLSEDVQSALSGSIWGWWTSNITQEQAEAAGLDMADPTTRRVLDQAGTLMGFPRHLSQHSGGFVITRDRLDEVVPIMKTGMEGRYMVEWDKTDLDALGILKIDVLALGMLTCLARGFELLDRHYGRRETLASVFRDQSDDVYDMICRADTIGVFQIESRAQMSMLPRLRPRRFYDLVIEVAIVRPGPIQGNMVHPYLKRRQNPAHVTYPSEELRHVLERTLGVPLFQEQAMQIAITAAGFTPGEADQLRRAMATFRRTGQVASFRQRMIDGMLKRNYERDFAERCFSQIEGFGEYGFPESHAASFALLVYASCWMKAFYPDIFCAAILNSQPMGFYAPSQLVRDAREHGVEVRPVDINHSGFDATIEPDVRTAGPGRMAAIHPRHRSMAGVMRAERAVRLGLRQVKGVSQPDMEQLVARRGEGYDTVRDLWLRSGLSRAVIERLADADAFRSIGLDRRAALWAVRALDGRKDAGQLPLFEVAGGQDPQTEPEVALPDMLPGEHVVNDYRYLSLSLKAHPVSFLRAELARSRILRSVELETTPSGRRVGVCGLVLVRQRPGSANGVIFMTLEDETGTANVIVWPKVFDRFRSVVMGARLVHVVGRLQNESGVIHVVADRIEDRTPLLGLLQEDRRSFVPESRADEVLRPTIDQRQKRPRQAPPAPASLPFVAGPQDRTGAEETARVMPKGRNFH